MSRRSDDIYTNSEYLKNTGDWHVEDSEWKAKIIYELYTKNEIHPKTIVEVGCGAGAILENILKLDNGVEQLDGFDISPQAISLAIPRTKFNLTFHQSDFLKENFPVADLLLMIDVMEHVDDFYYFLRELQPRGRNFIFHIPMDLSCRTILKPHVLLQQRKTVGHIHYFTEEMIDWILKDTGYKIIDKHYTKPIIDTFPVKGIKRKLKKILRNISFAINPSLSAKLWGGYSLLILAKPA